MKYRYLFLFFILFITSPCNSQTRCSDCNGYGKLRCSDCNGTGKFRCSDCNGTGKFRCNDCGGAGKFRCSNCNGYGVVATTVYNQFYGVYQQVTQACPNCRGYGYFSCSDCNGYGYFSCSDCNGYGYLICSDCNGKGYLQSSVSFKGKHCSGTVGCDCPGFEPITGQEVWKQSYCKHCNHKKSVHK